MSRIHDALRRAELIRSRSRRTEPGSDRAFRVVAVVSNKGGVGKTTVATNLAVFARALREQGFAVELIVSDRGSARDDSSGTRRLMNWLRYTIRATWPDTIESRMPRENRCKELRYRLSKPSTICH